MTNSERCVLLVNLGSPDTPEVADVRRYLTEFLMDEYVIDVPKVLRAALVRGMIVPFRSPKSAHAYRSIWWQEGSPLIVISRRVRELVQERVGVPVELAMRYGQPSIARALDRLRSAAPGMKTLFVVPLYPHFAMSTIGSTIAAVRDAVEASGLDVDLEFKSPFYDDPRYIGALVGRAREHLADGYDHVVLSYHGLPERHLKKTDPTGNHCLTASDCCSVSSTAHSTCYRHQVLRTTELFVEAAGIPRDRYTVSFQSRLGRDSWLKPSTVEVVEELASSGVKRLVMMSPAFVSDCLETLEELNIGIRKLFLGAGGESFDLIPCLNDHPAWIEALGYWCRVGVTPKAPPARESGTDVGSRI